MINGELCHKISKNKIIGCNEKQVEAFLLTRNDTVFFYDIEFNEFQILYNFNTVANNEWTIKIKDESLEVDSIIVHVDSISNELFNNSNLKVMHMTYHKIGEFQNFSYASKIVEKIGDLSYMFNWSYADETFCDGNYINGFRCYQDNIFGSYSSGIVDSCTQEGDYLGLDIIDSQPAVCLYPNPSNSIVHIEVLNGTNLNLLISDLQGKVIHSSPFTNTINFDVSLFESGLYLISISGPEFNLISKKLIVE